MAEICSCPICSYPVDMKYEGQKSVCAYCGERLEAISDVTIPTPVFVGVVAFALGVFLGPAIIASTTGGAKWLEEQARAKLR